MEDIRPRKSVIETITAYKAAYPQFGKDVDTKILLALWSRQLQSYTDEEIQKACDEVLKHETYTPSIATMMKYLEPKKETSKEALSRVWEEYETAYKRCQWFVSFLNYPEALYYDIDGNPTNETQREYGIRQITEVFNTLSEPLKIYFRSPKEFRQHVTQPFPDRYAKKEILQEFDEYIQQTNETFRNMSRPAIVSRADEVKELQAQFDAGYIIPQQNEPDKKP